MWAGTCHGFGNPDEGRRFLCRGTTPLFGGLMSASRYLLSGLVTVGMLASASAQAGQVRFNGDGHVMHPVFSQDGKHVAFEVNRLAGQVDLFMSEVNGAIAKDGTNVVLPGGGAFAAGDQVAANPTWHPQGIIVFEGSNQGGQYRLYFYQPGTGQAAEMIPTTQIPGHLTFPAISTDGSMMGFVAKETGNGDIRTRDSNSGSLAHVTKTHGTESFPMFSNDTSTLLFTRKHADTEDIFTHRLSDGMEKHVVQGPGDQTRPVYAANDGRLLYFDGARGEGQWDLMSVDDSGGDAKRISKGVRLPHRGRPAISSDGKWVAYTADDPQKGSMIMVSTVDGEKTVTINTSHTACGEPALTESNGRIVLAYTALPGSGAEWRFLTLVDITDKLQ